MLEPPTPICGLKSYGELARLLISFFLPALLVAYAGKFVSGKSIAPIIIRKISRKPNKYLFRIGSSETIREASTFAA